MFCFFTFFEILKHGLLQKHLLLSLSTPSTQDLIMTDINQEKHVLSTKMHSSTSSAGSSCPRSADRGSLFCWLFPLCLFLFLIEHVSVVLVIDFLYCCSFFLLLSRVFLPTERKKEKGEKFRHPMKKVDRQERKEEGKVASKQILRIYISRAFCSCLEIWTDISNAHERKLYVLE